ncbi:response regulator [Enterocloster bolteae]|uniref:response regulator n=1 Tax=Enterocloster bolteae TaxID=208479 RepID=UPI001FF1BB97|nr:response regulator [Enterocloster bolteae]UOX68009.1 response regulator [Enterocloster bolteae]
MGIDADWVQNGSTAVQMVLKAHEEYRDYNVCLIDWKMPDMDGIEVTRRIREELGPDTLVIIVSAYDWGEIENEAKAAGANAFIAKPLFESSLCHVLSLVVGIDRGAGEEVKASTVSFEGKHFLLAEDNELNREIAVELLKATGAQINCTENGKEAVDCFNASPAGYYDLILMDIQMPVMNGYEAARSIRRSNHEDAGRIPILAMTANAFHEDEEETMAAGMNGHIAKPIDIGVLFKTMSELLR